VTAAVRADAYESSVTTDQDNAAAPRCNNCGRALRPDAPPRGGLCGNCSGYRNAAGMTFGLLRPVVLAVEGGWRKARIFDGEFDDWLCPHVHATEDDAERCPDQKSLLAPDTRP
jgi:hypothetical protein